MIVHLNRLGYRINHKRVLRLMRQMGPRPSIHGQGSASRVRCVASTPHWLRGLMIDRPNQVWATDISYVPLARGFICLVAVMD